MTTKNPATLREAMTECVADWRKKPHRVAVPKEIQLRGNLADLVEVVRLAVNKCADELNAALAASGTEAVPRQCACGAYEESGGVCKDQCVACGAWLPERKPAQATASPEGEGRIVATQSTISLAHSAFKDLPPTICGSLRQSAAPSGAVQILRGQLYEHMEHCDNCIWERPCSRKRELDAARLAQESKTGAVTETK